MRFASGIRTCTRWHPTSLPTSHRSATRACRPKIRVTVVCPAGMATAWILVSRLLAVFPQVEIIRVVSKTAFERGADDVATDVVVSTVPLLDEDDQPPSVVVSPLLRDRDIRRLSRLLGEPT